MNKVVLICAAGMSTSLLVTKIRKAAERLNYSLDIAAFPIASLNEALKEADIILLGPQIRFELKKVKEASNCPVEVIDMKVYGTMDGEAVVKRIKEVMNDE